MWIAREEDNELLLFNDKPRRINAPKPGSWGGYWCPKMIEDFYSLDPDLFPNLHWEDEPLEVSLVPTS